MSKHASMAYGSAGIAALFAVLLAPRGAAAQPDPFDDYERWREGESDESKALPEEGVIAAPVGPWRGFNKGAWGVGGRMQFSYTGADNEVLEGVDESNNAFWFRLTPSVTYTPAERVNVALSMGVLSKSVSQQQGQDSDETNVFVEGAAYYHIPLSPRLSFIPGAGLGFYVGSGSRDLTLTRNGQPTVTEESTSTAGFSAALYLGVGYALTEQWQIRSGLALNALFGSESIDSSNESLSTSTVHIGLPIELYYAF